MSHSNDSAAEHVTRKSHHSLERDKPKHSGKLMRLHPRKDGFGKGNVGKPGEELNEQSGEVAELDERDPDYDSGEEEQSATAQEKQKLKEKESSSST